MCWCRTRTGLCPGHRNLQDQSQGETLVSKWFSVQPPKQHWPEPRSQSKWVSPISHGSQSTARSLMTYFALLKDNAGAHSCPKLPKWSNTLLEALQSLSYTDCMTRRCCISSSYFGGCRGDSGSTPCLDIRSPCLFVFFKYMFYVTRLQRQSGDMILSW